MEIRLPRVILPSRSKSASLSSINCWIVRRKGRAPNFGLYPFSRIRSFTLSLTKISIPWRSKRALTSCNIISTIESISFLFKGLNTTISSIRLINSGLNILFAESKISPRVFFQLKKPSVSPVMEKPRDVPLAASLAPTLLVIIITALRKSTVCP